VIEILCLFQLDVEIAILLKALLRNDGIAATNREDIEFAFEEFTVIDLVGCVGRVDHTGVDESVEGCLSRLLELSQLVEVIKY
jgi:hypothetical protein